jgi:hypothetical protein
MKQLYSKKKNIGGRTAKNYAGNAEKNTGKTRRTKKITAIYKTSFPFRFS